MPVTQQRALIVRVTPQRTEGLDALNTELQRGWRVVQVTPMGGTGLDERGDAPTPFLAALVVIERRQQQEEAPLAARARQSTQETEDEPAEIVKEVADGNGEVADENGTDPTQ